VIYLVLKARSGGPGELVGLLKRYPSMELVFIEGYSNNLR